MNNKLLKKHLNSTKESAKIAQLPNFSTNGIVVECAIDEEFVAHLERGEHLNSNFLSVSTG